LYLQVSAPGKASWLFRFMQHKRPHGMGLGSTQNWTLAEARERAKEARQLLDDGIDPLQHRRDTLKASAAAASMQKTFDAVAKEYIEKHRAEWSSPRHLAAWKNSIKRFASPVIGHMSVDRINKHHIMEILEPIWTTMHPTARVLRERLERIFGYAIARDYRAGDNPALWSTLENMLPTIKHEKKQRAAMPFAMVPKFHSELCTQSDAAALALRLLVLTSVRPGEILGHARKAHKVPGTAWSEFDLDAGLWTIPACPACPATPWVTAACDPLTRRIRGSRHYIGLDQVVRSRAVASRPGSVARLQHRGPVDRGPVPRRQPCRVAGCHDLCHVHHVEARAI
jgi:hypothetical protein